MDSIGHSKYNAIYTHVTNTFLKSIKNSLDKLAIIEKYTGFFPYTHKLPSGEKMNPILILIEEINSQNLWNKELKLGRNEYLKVKGSIDTNLYLVVNGSLRVFVLDEYEEHTIRFGYKDNLMAGLDSFINEKPSDLYIQALKKTTLKVIGKTEFMNLVSSSSKNTKTWLAVLENFVLQQMERERDILTTSPLERYNRVLKRSPQLFQEIPHKYIASYLRMTPETLSRIKKP